MSSDYFIWFPHQRLTEGQADALHKRLCKRDRHAPLTEPAPYAAIDVFYRKLVARYPEIGGSPGDRVGDQHRSPWSCPIDRSRSHVILTCVGSMVAEVETFVLELAKTHGLAVYNPQTNHIEYPTRSAQWARP